jgi:hypothetical protein
MKKFYTKKYCFVLIYLFFASVLSINGQSHIPSCNVSGTWQVTGSPFYIQGEITIPNDSTLTIEPGVEVVFMGHYKLNVQGCLLAVGTQQDTIYFTAENIQNGWHGIRFLNTPATNDSSKIMFCSFKHGNANTGSGLDRCGGAILISRFDKVLVSNCLFDSNKQSGEGWSPPEGSPAIYVYYASSIIRNSTFTKNKGSKGSAVGCITSPNSIVSNNIFLNNSGAFGPIVYASNSNGSISGNIISNNVSTWGGGGILIDNALTGGSSSPHLLNNIIIYNQAPKGGGIYCLTNANPVFINNTIAYNKANSGGGICCETNSDPIFINNILYGNSATYGSQINLVDNASDPIFTYCDIQGGKDEFGGSGSKTNYTGTYENNIDSDPLFKDTASMDYNLSETSLCIGTGIDSVEVLGKWYYAPLFDMSGNPRPNPTGSKPDMGAFESLLGSPTVGIEHDLFIPDKITLYQNYPNPFNSKTTIKYSVPESSKVVLKIYNITGKEIETIVNEKKPAGTYEVNWHAGNLPGGIYFYRLNAGGLIETRKMILNR